MLSTQSRKLFEIHKLKGVGRATLNQLLSLPAFETSTIHELASVNSKLRKAMEKPHAWEEACTLAEADLEKCANLGARVVSFLDDDYPNLLRITHDAPPFLYVLGHWASDRDRTLAVIGTRQPTNHGVLITERLTNYFVSNGWSIVSGLAIGCDTIAHKTAIQNSGHTVAVLAHGLHTVAPRQNERLAREIVDHGGALVTEYAFGVEPFAAQFVKRDRIQAGLARGVAMIQSDLEGGSLHASRAAIEYGRKLAVPCPTELDLSKCESKIGANLVLVGDDPSAKAKLLGCSSESLLNVIAVRNREDYPLLAASLTP